MHAVKFALAALAATAVQASAIDGDEVFAVLLKRQEPGTPAYNCHDNCGQAIIQAREDPDICDDDGFLSNYANCLQCAGPDNVGIWQYYGNGLAKAGESCGLDTEPAKGKQPDVGEAVPADGGSSPPSESTGVSPPASEATESEAATTESGSEPTKSDAEAEPTESEDEAEPTETGSDDDEPTESDDAEVEPTESDDSAEPEPTDDEEATSTDDSDAEESDDANASGVPSATAPPEVDAAGSLTIGFAGLGAAAAGVAVLLV